MCYWKFNYDTPGQKGFFSPESFRVLLSDIMFTLSVYITHIFMMSEARWTANENIVFFSKQSIVITLLVNLYS